MHDPRDEVVQPVATDLHDLEMTLEERPERRLVEVGVELDLGHAGQPHLLAQLVQSLAALPGALLHHEIPPGLDHARDVLDRLLLVLPGREVDEAALRDGDIEVLLHVRKRLENVLDLKGDVRDGSVLTPRPFDHGLGVVDREDDLGLLREDRGRVPVATADVEDELSGWDIAERLVDLEQSLVAVGHRDVRSLEPIVLGAAVPRVFDSFDRPRHGGTPQRGGWCRVRYRPRRTPLASAPTAAANYVRLLPMLLKMFEI